MLLMLSRARYGRNRTRFVTVPPELDCNCNNFALLNAALTAGMYPKILSIDLSNGQMRTISNNQPVVFHPSSVNFRRKPSDFGVNHLAYFTLMWASRSALMENLWSLGRHSKKLYAWETGPVDDVSMLLLCGEADFKVHNSGFCASQCLAELVVHLRSLYRTRPSLTARSNFAWPPKQILPSSTFATN
jgi:ATP-dependent RNA helicase DHX29